MEIDIQKIFEYLPHRYPFLLVDRVESVVPGESIVAIKNVTVNEPFFPGHFPGNPVMPGVLIIEALAQAGGLLVRATQEARNDATGGYMYLAGVEKARFRRAVVPGDQLRLEATLGKSRSRSCWMLGRAMVGDQVAAEANLLSMIVPGPEEA